MLDIFDMFKKIKIDLNKLQFRWRKTNLFSLEKCLFRQQVLCGLIIFRNREKIKILLHSADCMFKFIF